MKTNWPLYILVILFGFSLPLPLLAANWTFTNLGAATQITDTSAYDAFSTMMKASNGTIFNFYRKCTSHASDRGVIYLRTSTDSGVTWTLHDNGSGGVDTSHGCVSGDGVGCIFADATLDSRNTFGGVSYDSSTLIV